jgi:hypothetical protein
MIHRLASPVQLAARVAEPDMEGLVSGDFDASQWLVDPGNIGLTDGHNIMLFEAMPEAVWRGHWLLRDRGRKAFLTAANFLRYMYALHGARVIVGLVPAHCRASRWFTRQMGFVSGGVVDTEQGHQEFFSMTLPQFEARYGFFEKQEGGQQL